jgi:conjugative transfer region protein TrbK
LRTTEEDIMKAARLVACLFLSVAALNAARVVAQQTNGAATPPIVVTDPLAKELERCKALHEQAATDARCQAAYKESRKRFFTPPSDYQPGKVEMFPKSQSEPWTTEKKPVPPSTEK